VFSTSTVSQPGAPTRGASCAQVAALLNEAGLAALAEDAREVGERHLRAAAAALGLGAAAARGAARA